MTTPFKSNFTTNFSGTTSIMDMLSSTSGDIDLSNNLNNITLKGRYFYLGNLLIQFTSTIIPNNNDSQSLYQVYFPITYDSNNKPYMILTTPLSNGGNTNVVVNSWTESYAYITPGSNDSFAMFMVIGPRPVSSY